MSAVDCIALGVLGGSCVACAWIGCSFARLAKQLRHDQRNEYRLPPQWMEARK